MTLKWILITVLIILLAGFAAWGPIVSNVERPDYDIMMSQGSIEVREYTPLLVAEVQTTGDRDQAISKGFRKLADFIFGNNIKTSEIAMTAPVSQQPADGKSEKIPMTAPVSQQEAGENTWHVRFVMPSKYTMETLPKPENDEIEIKKQPAKTYAAIQFSGLKSKANIKKHEKQLADFLEGNNLTPQSAPIYAFYNPPWTLPFLRRNEVMVEVER